MCREQVGLGHADLPAQLLGPHLGHQSLHLLLDRGQADQLGELGHRVADLDRRGSVVGRVLVLVLAEPLTGPGRGRAGDAGDRRARLEPGGERVPHRGRRPEDRAHVLPEADPVGAAGVGVGVGEADVEVGDVGRHNAIQIRAASISPLTIARAIQPRVSPSQSTGSKPERCRSISARTSWKRAGPSIAVLAAASSSTRS